jgi:hypothetical protein
MGATSTQTRPPPATFACDQCGASLVFDGVRTRTCPYCASPNFVERPPSAQRPDPRFVIPFAGDAVWARGVLARWLGRRRLFADSALRRAAVLDIRGVYVPVYLYSAVARTEYTARIGEHYTETETVKTRKPPVQGRRAIPIVRGRRAIPDDTERVETRTVVRTEYRPLAGRHVGYVTDLVVSASAGLSNVELGRIEPFDMRQIHRFAPALISGWITEEFSRTADDCRRASRGEAVDEVGARLRAFMPGDSHADLAWRTTVEWESLDPMLVPVWVFAVRYRPEKPPLRVLINGQTARITGAPPLVWWKIALALIVLAALIAAFVLIVREPPP